LEKHFEKNKSNNNDLTHSAKTEHAKTFLQENSENIPTNDHHAIKSHFQI